MTPFIDLVDRLAREHQRELSIALEKCLNKHRTHRGVVVYEHTDRLGYFVSCGTCGIDKQKVLPDTTGGGAGPADYDPSGLDAPRPPVVSSGHARAPQDEQHRTDPAEQVPEKPQKEVFPEPRRA